MIDRQEVVLNNILKLCSIIEFSFTDREQKIICYISITYFTIILYRRIFVIVFKKIILKAIF